MPRRTLSLAVFATLACCVSPAAAEIRVAHILGSHMVLQQDQPIRIWGWAAAGETVTASRRTHSR